MKRHSFLAGAVTIGLALPGFLVGAPTAVHAQSVASGQTGGSVAFVRDAGQAGLFEAQSGRLALERSQHAGVRGYAAQSVKGASDMLDRVKFINQSNVAAPMPDALSNADQAELDRMARLGGADFDRAYIQSQVETSRILASMFHAYGATGESETMRLYAAETATTYENQETLARTVMGSL